MSWEDTFIPVDQNQADWTSSFVPVASAASPAQPEEKPEPSTGEKLLTAANAPFSGLVNAGVNTALGASQALGSMLPANLPINLPGYGPLDIGSQAGTQGINDLKSIIDQQNSEAMKDNPAAKAGFVTGDTAGNMALFSALGGANPGYIAPTAAGVMTGEMQPANSTEDRLWNAGYGGGGALVGAGLGNMMSSQVSEPTKQAILQTAEDFNIPVFRSQVSDSPITKAVASFEKDVPGSGAIGKVADQVSKFNSAVLGTIGEEGTAVTPEALRSADTRIGKVYSTMTGKYDLKVTPDFETKLLQLNDAAKTLGDQGKEYALQNQVDNVMSKIKNGVIDGNTYQGMRSQISGLMRGQNASPELGKLLDTLDGQFQNGMNTRDLVKFQQARGQYRNMLSLERVVANSPNEPISPAKLQGAVKNVFGDYAYAGGSDLERLARLGNVLKDSFPNSGTATRAQLYELAKHALGPAIGIGVGTGEGYREGGLGGAFAGATAGLAANRLGITPYLYSQMRSDPSLARSFLPALGAAAPFALAPPVNR